MITVTVCIPHVNTPWYLETCLKCIRAFPHPEVDLQLIVVDQSDPAHADPCVIKRLCENFNAKLVTAKKVDAGYPIDIVAGMANGYYFCSLDVDAFPIHKNWLWMPIQIIERGLGSWVGFDTGLGLSYKDKGNFIHLNNYFRVCKTELAKRISADVGFQKWESHSWTDFQPRNREWEQDGKFVACDNGVVSQWYADRIKSGPKIALASTGCVGMTRRYGVYGACLEDMVIHMVFGYGEAWIKNDMEELGSGYLELKKRMCEGADPAFVVELGKKLLPGHKSRYVDGVVMTPETYALIEEIKRS